MKKIFSLLILAMLTSSSLACGAEDSAAEDTGIFADSNFSATLTFTTDYVYRGVSLSDNEPAIQGSFDYSHPDGVYVGLWGSNVDVDGTSIEIDYYAGYAGELAAFGYDLSTIYYSYPGANDDEAEFNYFEFFIKGSYEFDMTMAPVIGLDLSYSPEYYGEDGDMYCVISRVDLTLVDELQHIDSIILTGEIGYQDVEGDKSTGYGFGLDGNDGYDYTFYKIALSTSLKGFDLVLDYTDTDEEEFLGESLADERFTFSVSRSF